ncbi:hypothetical protein [Verrucomicrobium spinosum]|uniref:hypothetical protein n=1 Tax=Verrucomicrobium spinosum TaxID=2736 RepID=UPI000946542B|nr:hypothetical protein [Verrucomicrobium spinosum]
MTRPVEETLSLWGDPVFRVLITTLQMKGLGLGHRLAHDVPVRAGDKHPSVIANPCPLHPAVARQDLEVRIELILILK